MMVAVMYGYTPMATMEKFAQGTTREHVEQTEELLLLEELPQGFTIDTRHGDVRSEPKDSEQAQRKKELTPNIGKLECVCRRPVSATVIFVKGLIQPRGATLPSQSRQPPRS